MAEIRDSRAELQEFVACLFDRLDGLLQRQLDDQAGLVGNLSCSAEREAMQGPIEQLAAVAAELTELVAEQKRLLAKQERH